LIYGGKNNGSSIAAVRQMLATHTMAEMQEAAEAALKCRTEAEVLALLKGILG